MGQDDVYANLTQLGSRTELPKSPEEAVLERVGNTQSGVDYCVRFTALRALGEGTPHGASDGVGNRVFERAGVLCRGPGR